MGGNFPGRGGEFSWNHIFVLFKCFLRDVEISSLLILRYESLLKLKEPHVVVYCSDRENYPEKHN